MRTEFFSIKSLLIVAGLTALFLLPFINKAFHIDDALFLWSAKQIQLHPCDFFGFTANWSGVERPMYLINQNPPLVSYYIALVTSLFGWSEIALHIAFLIPAVCLSIGIYLLALLFCPLALIAALIAIATPAFIVSSTNVMCDILMVSFYVWAAVFWLYGMEKDKTFYFFTSGLFIALSTLTKYFGISMVPLLLAYTVIKKRGFDIRLFFLTIPVFVMLGYQWLTFTLYDTSLLSNAASYAIDRGIADSPDRIIDKTMIGLSFCGGCLAVVLFYSHLLWSRIFLFIGALLVSSLTGAYILFDSFSANPLIDMTADPKIVIVQFILFVMIGSQIMCLAAADVLKNKDAKSVFLLLWVLGTFFFASHVNWTINARTILPMIPAVGILVARRLNDRYEFHIQGTMWRLIFPLIPGVLITLIVSWGDASFANCQRSIAQNLNSGFKNYQGNLWFQGHWGFQYYMQLYEAKPLDYKNSLIGIGDIIVIPKTNTGQLNLPPDKFTFVKRLECDPFQFAGTMSKDNRACFYSNTNTGKKLYLPFAFGDIEPEEYFIFIVGKFKDPEKFIRKSKGDI